MTARLATLAVVVAGLACGAAVAQTQSHSQLERGRYLAIVGNCVSCHTDYERDGKPWAGGRELETPFGVIVTPNLTPDPETGIGRWTRDDFRRALHEGVRADGAHLYPALPYVYFTRMPRQDVDAIYDYLRTLEPVQAEHEPEAHLPAPLRIRAGIRAWKLLNFDRGVFQPDPDRSEAWNRGRYLVDGPAHCGGCHTGKNALGGDRESEYLRGGVLENWHAPNIRGGENGGIADWSEDDIVAFLATGRASRTVAMVRMGEVVSHSTQHMTDSDRRAIATYLKSLEDEPRQPPEAAEAASLEAGAAIYFDNCAACHRSDGEGVPYTFARLNGSNKLNSDDPTTVLRIVLQGARAEPTLAEPGTIGMPAFGWKLSDEEIADLVTYLRNAWDNRGAPVSASEVASLREALAE